jgi:branched-chain amino acid transport system substrate-binding protein
VGVVGWSNSPTSFNANAVLAHQPKENENVFMLAPSSSSKSLSGAPGFLRIVPDDIEQTGYIANYAYNRLEYRKMAILYEPDTIFSADSFSSFKEAFKTLHGSIVSEQRYAQGDEASLRAALSKALQSHPDGIYMPGFAADAGLLLSFPEIANQPSRFKILGGHAMASPSDYPANQQNLERLILLSYVSQDEWKVLRVEQVPEVAAFVKNYESTFKNNIIGLGTMVTYDAVNVFLRGYQMVLASGGPSPCLSCALQQALQSMHGAQAWQGVSGQIAFDESSTEAIDKVISISHFENGTLKTIEYRGCFLVDRTDCRN